MTFNHIVIQNILRDKWTYVSYFLSSMFSIIIFFLFSVIVFHPSLKSLDPDSTLGISLMLASMLVYLFSFIYITYSIMAFLRKKTKTLGIFMITGASMKQVRKLIFRENLFIGIMAIIAAIVLGLVMTPLFLMAAKVVLKAETFSMYIPLQAIGLTIGLFLILFMVISIVVTKFINKEASIQLLKSDTVIEKSIQPHYILLAASIVMTALLAYLLKIEHAIVESLSVLYYLLFFASIISTIYLVIAQGLRLFLKIFEKSPAYLRKTNMLLASNLNAKMKSHANMLFLITLLLSGVFLCTSILFSSYYNVQKDSEGNYPYSFQYIADPKADDSIIQANLDHLEAKLAAVKANKYFIEFKSDENRRLGYMSLSDYNLLQQKEFSLNENEFIAVAGNHGIAPITNIASDRYIKSFKLAEINEKNLLSTGFQETYFIVPDSIYQSIDYPVYKTYIYELENWTAHTELAKTITENIPSLPGERYVTSKINLYDTEMFVKSVMFFIGSMLSLIFLSAAMSILYFYLQTTLLQEKEKYMGIRKLGLSNKELASVIAKELAILIFVPFTIAILLLLTTLLAMRTMVSTAFLQVSIASSCCFFVLFLISYLWIRKNYFKRLVN
ncbi:MAG: FtsX-like permease family protein [Lysinibacillus fusiformis]|uniref:FtsX-like permease family protein n=1 Tax=Lysinibacillus TaxID=400634 RepID=UPI000500C91C|nr:MULTISPECIES: FtsX-like permease family protein [Lysinibacillus]MDC6269945.1 FtsX-like permease family protein [Lysinibacillus sphaericus]KGA84814.1 ABC transporter permease [Lysinibacillus fusiformis]MCK1990465.1 FtsX-like permease family protein [Lysinibacillus fusiformis]MCT6816227.1 FtsX-like permease family protein [Lysinibacillus fusiformis]MCT6929950.1 FtsX-like permease family protein [Lysinibacillus fusiformis]